MAEPKCEHPHHVFPPAVRRCYCGRIDVPQLYERHDKSARPMPEWYRRRQQSASALKRACVHPWDHQRRPTPQR